MTTLNPCRSCRETTLYYSDKQHTSGLAISSNARTLAAQLQRARPATQPHSHTASTRHGSYKPTHRKTRATTYMNSIALTPSFTPSTCLGHTPHARNNSLKISLSYHLWRTPYPPGQRNSRASNSTSADTSRRTHQDMTTQALPQTHKQSPRLDCH